MPDQPCANAEEAVDAQPVCVWRGGELAGCAHQGIHERDEDVVDVRVEELWLCAAEEVEACDGYGVIGGGGEHVFLFVGYVVREAVSWMSGKHRGQR